MLKPGCELEPSSNKNACVQKETKPQVLNPLTLIKCDNLNNPSAVFLFSAFIEFRI